MVGHLVGVLKCLEDMAQIGWLSVETPDRDGGGGQRRQFHQIRTLVESGFEVRAITLTGPQSDATLRELVPVDRFEARRWPRKGLDPELLHGVATAVVAHVESLAHVEPALRDLDIPFAVDFHNVHSRWHGSRGEPREATRWHGIETRALRTAACAFACSDEEASALRELVPSAMIEVAGHGIATDEWPDTEHEREPIVAVFGSWGHEPNREALAWLNVEVWPQVASEVPDARLVLLGPGEPPPVAGAQHLGRVDSLADTLGRVRVVAVPIRRGMGARVKFGEALASGAAVVSTTVGAEGFDAQGTFVCADDAGEFAQACIDLLCDPERAVELGQRGRELALTRLTWERTSKPLVRWLGAVTQ